MDFATIKSQIKNARPTILLGISAFFNTIVTFARMKLAILSLGPEAVGILGYLLSVSTFAAIFFSFGLSVSANTIINQDKSYIQKQTIFYWSVIGSISSLIFFYLIFGHLSLKDSLIHFNIDQKFFTVAIFLFVISGVIGSIISGILDGKKLSIFRFVASTIALIAIISSYINANTINSLILFWCAAPFGTLFAVLLIFRERPIKELMAIKIFQPNMKWSITKSTISTSLSLMTTTTIVAISHIFLRELIFTHSGMLALSEFQVSWSLSMAIFSFLGASTNSIFLASISRQAKNDVALAHAYKKHTVTLVIISLPVYAIAYAFVDPIINILFSADFNSAKEIFRAMIFGDIIKIIVAPATLILLIKNKYLYVFSEVLSAIIFILLVLLLLKKNGEVTSVGDAYFYSYIFNAFICLLLWQVIFSKKNTGAKP